MINAPRFGIPGYTGPNYGGTGGPGSPNMLGLNPSANVSGSMAGSPLLPMPSTGTVGGPTNPFVTGYDAGTSTYPLFPANTGGTTSTGTPAGGTTSTSSDPTSSLGAGMNWNDFYTAAEKSYGSGVAHALTQFLQSGAGYNPQVLQALWNQMQPQIERGQEQVMEQFGAQGNRFGSPAAIGLGDYMSQVENQQQAMAAQLYEQAVQNYMQTLTGMEPAALSRQQYDWSQPSIWQQLGSGISGGLGLLSGLGGISGIAKLF